MRVKDKIAIVTGGCGGIGAQSARVLAGEGADVILADLDEKKGQQIAQEIGGRFHALDVTDRSAWQALAERVFDDRGRIDILVQCAGIEGDNSRNAFETPPEVWNQVIAVNMTGTFFGCQAVMPFMLQQGAGSVVLLSSIVSFMSTATSIPYGASKAGVQHLAQSFAYLGSRDGKKVRVNSVHPGSIKTRMTDDIIADLAKAAGCTKEEAEAKLLSSIPFGRRGAPQDVAQMILYLVSDEAAYVTGGEFKIDGGWLVRDVIS